jgi:LAO/AO transport system kinase
VAKIADHREFLEAEGKLDERRRRNLHNEVLAIAVGRMRKELMASLQEDDEVQGLLDEVVARRKDPASAAARILERSAERIES